MHPITTYFPESFSACSELYTMLFGEATDAFQSVFLLAESFLLLIATARFVKLFQRGQNRCTFVIRIGMAGPFVVVGNSAKCLFSRSIIAHFKYFEKYPHCLRFIQRQF
jgi:hypothetical protein